MRCDAVAVVELDRVLRQTMTLVGRLRAGLRAHVPQPVRRLIAQTRRRAQDARAAAKFTFTTTKLGGEIPPHFVSAVEIVQPIRRTAHFEGKLHNIALAVSRLDRVCLAAGEALSFWQAVGLPSVKNGFQLGRGIVADRLSADVGGGLCQIASMLYELGLRGGCRILERHAHSRDLYREDNRFTPLGLDAAVAWGFKDVRVANVHEPRLVLGFAVEGEMLRGRLCSEAPIPVFDLELTRYDAGIMRVAEVCARDRAGKTSPISRDAYIIDPT